MLMGRGRLFRRRSLSLWFDIRDFQSTVETGFGAFYAYHRNAKRSNFLFNALSTRKTASHFCWKCLEGTHIA
ncbi:hypothetical protein CFBP5473_02960 [Agrobacterium larrymoorei]|uniref:Uncharacterized protein n=1 Tax=Agrobacterium larrymoorei TaxID=160699 RepID=A0A4D7DMU4_9HYPH|nr:hypothetical protein CFBP5473_02960 [Agrobacterium larrymoorei]